MIGKKLKELRISNGYDQQYLAYKLGISQCHISGIETGHRYPSVEVLELYATFFNKPPVMETIIKNFTA
jgi:transcriptional regulator with XRE-family HTH domain